MITRLSLKKFRIFENIAIELGQMVTAIAGHNATGKSTLLGVIGNSCELKAKDGRTITAAQFRTEFSELFKGSQKYDATGQIGSLFINNNGKETEISLRVAWQRYKSQSKKLDRFRIIPKWTRQAQSTEGKYPLPSLYLGLSRLYPLGETPTNEVKRKRLLSAVSDADRKWLYRTYNHILTLSDPIESISNYGINKKISGGINTSRYDYLTNSSGQDNLMQILYALLSFKILSKKMKAQWKGGVLLIDEVDSTLHPVAQIRLLDAMLEVCEDTGLQILFTTHSLQLLDCLSKKSSRIGKGKIAIDYLTTANRNLEVHVNPDLEFIHNDMMIASSAQASSRKLVIVYSEDAEARWLLGKLLSGYKRYVKIVNMNFGCDQAKNWIKTDPDYFKNILFVLDGDAKITEKAETSSARSVNSKGYENIVKLPGSLPPEKVLYDYLLTLRVNHDYLQKNAKRGLSVRYFEQHGPDSSKYSHMKDARERNKRWFNDNRIIFEESNLFEAWAHDNDVLLKKFIKHFLHCHNIIAARTGAEKIPVLQHG